MTAKARKDEIIRVLKHRGQETMPQLAHELGVSMRTIQRDILALTVDEHYHLETVQSNGGGVILKDFKGHYKRRFRQDEIKVLTDLVSKADRYQAEILKGLFTAAYITRFL